MKTFETVFATGNDENCVSATLLNAIYDFEGVCAAKRAFEQLAKGAQFLKLVSYTCIFHSYVKKFQLQKVQKGIVNPVRRLWEHTRSTFLVRVAAKNIGHFIAVNCRGRIIGESAEKLWMKVTFKMLRAWAKSDVSDLKIGEIRELSNNDKSKMSDAIVIDYNNKLALID